MDHHQYQCQLTAAAHLLNDIGSPNELATHIDLQAEIQQQAWVRHSLPSG
jgi:hypothetical protein